MSRSGSAQERRARPARLTVVVVAFNSDGVIGGSLRALGDAARVLHSESGLATDVVVVDNCSSRPLALPDVGLPIRLFRLATNIGFAPAANLGAAGSGSELLLFLNPDVVLFPSALTHLASAFIDSAVAVAGPLMVNRNGEPILSERPFHSLKREARTQLFPGRARRAYGRRQFAAREGRCLTGACVMVDRAFFEDVGGFDTDIRMYLEDVELCWQAHARRRRVAFVPTARCVHGLGASSSGANFATRSALHLTLLSARVEFVRRRRGLSAAVAMRALIAAGALGRIGICFLQGAQVDRHRDVLAWALRRGTVPAWSAVAAAVRPE